MSGAGELRSRLTFGERVTGGDDGYGNVEGGFADRFTCFAQVTPRLGGETVEAARLTGKQPFTIRVRQSPDTLQIRTDWMARNELTGTQYNIRTVADPCEGDADHGLWLDMMADAGVAI